MIMITRKKKKLQYRVFIYLFRGNYSYTYAKKGGRMGFRYNIMVHTLCNLVFVEQKKHFFIRNTCCGEKMRKLKKKNYKYFISE